MWLKTAILFTCTTLVLGQSCSSTWGQCGGEGWSGPTCCQSGTTCTYSNPWYSQCLPGTATTTTHTTTTTQHTTTTKHTTTTTGSTSGNPGGLRVGNGAPFIKGYNNPWGQGYGHYLGEEPSEPSWGVSYSSSETTSYLNAMTAGDTNFWRVWLFEAAQGLVVNSNGYLTGVQSIFWTNFDDLVNQAQAHGVYLYPTLFAGGVTNGDMPGVANFITNSAAQTSVIDNVIKPLITRYKGRSIIAVWQIWNEMNQWCNPYFNGQLATVAQCAAFVSTVAQVIKSIDPGHLVSVSQIYINDAYHPIGTWNADFKDTGVDFYDIHVYNDEGTLPLASAFDLDKPILLGEFGESTGEGDAHQNTVVSTFLANARANGWAGCLYWTLGEPGAAISGCNENTLTWSMYGCSGQTRPAYYSYKSG